MKHRKRVGDCKRNIGRTLLEAKYNVKPYGDDRAGKQRGAQNTNTDCRYEFTKFLKVSIYNVTTVVELVPSIYTTSPVMGAILCIEI